MRKTFAKFLASEMEREEKIILLTGDLGYGLWDEIRSKFPERFINTGSAEQLLIGMAVGMIYEGFIPVCYSISPFLIFRPFEMLRNYIIHENLPIKLVGSGRGVDYAHDGFTHWALDIPPILDEVGIHRYQPRIQDNLEFEFREFMNHSSPAALFLSKEILIHV